MAKNKKVRYRPYVKLSVVDLETLAENHWDDNKFLSDIRKELSCRKTSRAKKLESIQRRILCINSKMMIFSLKK